jgi:phage tail protein X
MTATITAWSQSGETLDAVIWRVLKSGPELLKPTIDMNPELVEHGMILPEGTIIILPNQLTPTVADIKIINLWD